MQRGPIDAQAPCWKTPIGPSSRIIHNTKSFATPSEYRLLTGAVRSSLASIRATTLLECAARRQTEEASGDLRLSWKPRIVQSRRYYPRDRTRLHSQAESGTPALASASQKRSA